jgi:hypothetical protein
MEHAERKNDASLWIEFGGRSLFLNMVISHILQHHLIVVLPIILVNGF